MFDSSIVRGEPATFTLTRVIGGWTEGLQLMTEGESRRFWIPANLAYGDEPRHPGAPSGQLTFDIELLEILKTIEVPVPVDVAFAPTNATTTRSGLKYVELSKGTGRSPGPRDRVTVHYSGWTLDGKMFDSSVVRGKPATFGVQQVIEGWTEALQLMSEGSKVRVWIPANLAYGESPQRPGAPSGQLTFDIELIAIEKSTND
jgi:peptidylprolyl isomerase